MDSITQAALGAALGGAIAGRVLGRKALLGGALLGTLPDLDVLIDYGSAVADFTLHRGFSHSLLVLLPFSALLAWALQRWRPVMSYRHWWLFCGATLMTHPILDAFTTYGTQLWWPLGDPVALNSVFIIDPLYTLPLLAAITLFLWRPAQPRALVTGLILSTGYLGWSLMAQQLVNERVTPTLAELGAADAPRLVQPMPLTTLLWRVTVMDGDRRLEMVTGLLDGDAPLHVETFPTRPELAAAAQRLPEGQRLAWFTRSFLDYTIIEGQLAATDVRLGVPGAHPFTFVLAKRQDGQWQPARSSRHETPTPDRRLLGTLWQRLTGEQPVLCLATLQAQPDAESCS